MNTPRPARTARSSRTTGTTGRTWVHRTVALAGTAMLSGGAALVAAAPAQAEGAVLDPVMVQRSCKIPGKSGTPNYGYYSSVVLRGSDTGPSTFTFDSMQVKKNPAMTQITPKQVTVPAKSTTTVTIQVTGATNSANGPGILTSTLQQGGTTSQHSSTIANFFPMQSADCQVSYPSNVSKPWPVSGPGVVSADLTGKALNVPAAAQGATTSVVAGHNGNQYALKTDGSVVGWDRSGETVALPGDWNHLRSIDGYNGYALAVTADGTVAATGNGGGRAVSDMVGKTGMKTISTNYEWSIGLTDQGAVVAGGNTDSGDAYVPDGYGLDHGVKQAIAIWEGAIALKDDGTIVQWDLNGVQSVPAEVHDVTAIAANSWAGFVALRADGDVVYWGQYGYGVTVATGATRVALTEPDLWGIDNDLFVQKQDGTVTAVNIAAGTTTPVPAMKGATDLQGAGDAAVASVPGT